eukprot:356891-Chlamydomonas_euryale.AAC.12
MPGNRERSRRTQRPQDQRPQGRSTHGAAPLQQRRPPAAAPATLAPRGMRERSCRRGRLPARKAGSSSRLHGSARTWACSRAPISPAGTRNMGSTGCKAGPRRAQSIAHALGTPIACAPDAYASPIPSCPYRT